MNPMRSMATSLEVSDPSFIYIDIRGRDKMINFAPPSVYYLISKCRSHH